MDRGTCWLWPTGSQVLDTSEGLNYRLSRQLFLQVWNVPKSPSLSQGGLLGQPFWF